MGIPVQEGHRAHVLRDGAGRVPAEERPLARDSCPRGEGGRVPGTILLYYTTVRSAYKVNGFLLQEFTL